MPATPALQASGNILPHRFVKIAADNSAQAAGSGERAVGVSEGSLRAFDSANHAESGDSVQLQDNTKSKVIVELGGSVTAGNVVMSGAAGVGVVATSTNVGLGVAAQSGASGDLIEIVWGVTNE